ncbi:Mitochondrial ribosomal protein, small subunit, putative, partial [Candida maltosa Xu316]
MKSAVRLFKYIQSIKFVGGPHPTPPHSAGPHPMAPNGLAPSKATSNFRNSNPVEPQNGEYFSRAE